MVPQIHRLIPAGSASQCRRRRRRSCRAHVLPYIFSLTPLPSINGHRRLMSLPLIPPAPRPSPSPYTRRPRPRARNWTPFASTAASLSSRDTRRVAGRPRQVQGGASAAKTAAAEWSSSAAGARSGGPPVGNLGVLAASGSSRSCGGGTRRLWMAVFLFSSVIICGKEMHRRLSRRCCRSHRRRSSRGKEKMKIGGGQMANWVDSKSRFQQLQP